MIMFKRLIPKTKKAKIASLLVVLFALVGTFVLLRIFAASSQITLTTNATSNLKKDDTFVVTVTASTGGEPVSIGQAYIAYDPAKLAYVSSDYTGSAFDSDSPEATTGNGFVLMSRYTTTRPSGNLLIGKITFKVLASSGSAALSVDQSRSYVFSAQDASNILTGVNNASVTISSPQTPTTASAQINMTASKTSVSKDETFVVSVNANSGSEPVTIGQAYLTFDPAKLAYVSTDYTGSAFPSDTPEAATGSGFVKLSRYTTSNNPSGNFLIGKVTFKAVAAGTTANIGVDTSKSAIHSLSDASNILDGANSLSITIASAPVTGDTQAPAKPANLTATANGQGQISLSWSASTDNVGVTSYQVYRGSELIADSVTGTTYTVSGLAPNTGYSFTVVARDAAGNVSTPSDPATAQTPNVEDITKPNAPASLNATAVSSTQVNLSWQAAVDNVGVTKYILYRDNEVLNDNVTSTEFGDNSASQGTTYVYAVKAVDAAGNVSDASNSAIVSTPTPDPTNSNNEEEPVVVVVSPTTPTNPPVQVPQGKPIQPRTSATTTKGKKITKTEYTLNNQPVATSTGEPVTIDTSTLAPGTYDLRANSTAEDGSTETSTQKVQVNSPSFFSRISAPLAITSGVAVVALVLFAFRFMYMHMVPFYKTIH